MKNFSLMEFLVILSLIIIASVANLIILNDLGFVQMEKIVSKITKPSPLPNVPPAPPVACTEEAKVCLDGSSVGRTGPNCEFATCQGEENCAKEGEMISTMPTATGVPGKQCCSGLKEITPDYLLNEKCTQIVDAAVCAYCPNGICGMGENQCNCSQDCKEIDTSDWQTYRSEDYGFEVKFPADLTRQGRATTEPEIYWDGKLNGIPYILTSFYISQNTLNTMGSYLLRGKSRRYSMRKF